MARGARVIVAFLAARTAFGLAYLTGAARDLPTLWYRPLERAWQWSARPAGFAMEWYGRTLTSLIVATAVAAIVWVLTARPPLTRALEKSGAVIAIAQAAGLALLVDFAYFGWLLMTQAPSPLPLPPGCAP